jgi:hypothetical protein
MEETQQELTPEQQLAELAIKQQKLQQQIEQAKSERAQKQIDAISASATKRKDEEAQERLILEELKKKRKAREAEQQAEIDRQNEAGRLQIEQRNAQAAAEKLSRQKAEALFEKIKEENAKAYALEAELQRALLSPDDEFASSEEAKPITLSSLPLPLSRLFAPPTQDETVAAPDYQGMTSEQNAQRQMKLDRTEDIKEFGPSTSTVQTALPTPVPTPKKTNRKAQRFVDMSVSTQLEKLLKDQNAHIRWSYEVG